MAGAPLIQRIQLQGGQEIIDQLQKMGKEGEKAIQQIQKASEAISAGKGGFLGGLNSAVASAKKAFAEIGTAGKSLGKSFGEVNKTFGEFGSALRENVKNVGIFTAAVAGAAAGVVALAKGAADNAQEISDTAESFGLTTDQVQKFEAAAKLSGGSLQDVTGILSRLDVTLAKTGAAAGGAAAPLGDFADNVVTLNGAASQFAVDAVKVTRGLDDTKKAATAAGAAILNGLAGKAAGEQLQELANRVNALPTQIEKVQALLSIGIRGEALGRTLDTLRAIAETNDLLLPVINETSIALGNKLSAAINATFINLGRLKDGLIDTFAAPALTQALTTFNQFLIANEGRINAFAASLRDRLTPVIQGVTAALTGAQIGGSTTRVGAAAARPDQLGATPQVDTAALTAQEQEAAKVRDAVLEIKDAFLAVASGARTAFDILRAGFAALQTVANTAATAINNVFGTQVSGNALLIAAALLQLLGVFNTLFAALRAGAALILLFTNPWALLVIAIGAAAVAIAAFWPQISAGAAAAIANVQKVFTEGFKGLVDGLSQRADEIGGFFSHLWDNINQTFTEGWAGLVAGFQTRIDQIGALFQTVKNAITGAFSDAINTVEGLFNGLVGFVSDIADQIASAVSRAVAAIQSLFSAQSQASQSAPASAGGGSGFAGGGLVRGPGTTTSDSILARLSRGEVVEQERAVRYYGVDFMLALNALKVPRDRLRAALRGFSLGGLVDGIGRGLDVPRFAAGGLVGVGAPAGGGRPLVLQLPGGQTIGGMTASESAVAQLQRHVSRRVVHRAGGTPSWASGR